MGFMGSGPTGWYTSCFSQGAFVDSPEILIGLDLSLTLLELELLCNSIPGGDVPPSFVQMHPASISSFFLLCFLPTPDGPINRTQGDPMPVLFFGKTQGVLYPGKF